MTDKEKILKTLSSLLETGILTVNDVKKELITNLKFRKDDIVSKLDLVSREEFDVLKKLVEKHNIDPKLCGFVEDIARNLKPAYEMGMKTVWIENEEPWAKKFSDSNFIDFKTNNLSEFLKQINLLKAA